MILSRFEKFLNYINIFILAIVGLVSLFPIMYVFSVSFTPLDVIQKSGGFQIIPSKFTLDAYEYILSQDLIPRAFMNSVILTVSGTLINIVLTILLAYPLARKNLPGRNIFLIFILIPMLFSGGLVPLFILVKNLKLMNTFWAVILPGAIWTYNVLIMKSFFSSLPEEIFEAAKIDGADEWTILRKIVLPLSTPVIATITLIYAVDHWNDFFYPLMFLTDQKLQPLQVVLRNVLADLLTSRYDVSIEKIRSLPGETIRMAAVVISIIPMLAVYPWLQKYFTKGMTLGSIKG